MSKLAQLSRNSKDEDHSNFSALLWAMPSPNEVWILALGWGHSLGPLALGEGSLTWVLYFSPTGSSCSWHLTFLYFLEFSLLSVSQLLITLVPCYSNPLSKLIILFVKLPVQISVWFLSWLGLDRCNQLKVPVSYHVSLAKWFLRDDTVVSAVEKIKTTHCTYPLGTCSSRRASVYLSLLSLHVPHLCC